MKHSLQPFVAWNQFCLLLGGSVKTVPSSSGEAVFYTPIDNFPQTLTKCSLKCRESHGLGLANIPVSWCVVFFPVWASFPLPFLHLCACACAHLHVCVHVCVYLLCWGKRSVAICFEHRHNGSKRRRLLCKWKGWKLIENSRPPNALLSTCQDYSLPKNKQQMC